ncbi:ADP-ribosyltransferase domain-containing protein [Collimonas pratensis]|uniref:NAD(+)--protein-arginine ADP-ribosyltransferase n=1 Tax=Collimonas pratensis TaxID=279113 RepID=A0A127QAG4_9BURK|nr:ADP-ribosyltransferase domain-containing protein [Collimonas pratensis]AMP06976.1 NAD:arginine ADP-ribosyltransferase family protein [Collimonas pratensis]
MNASRVSLLREQPSFTTQSPTSFRKQFVALGRNYRTSEADQREFIEAFVAHRNDNLFQDGQQDYADYSRHIKSVIEKHPSLANIPLADLVALRVWTSNDYGRVQDSLETGQQIFPESVPFARAIVSALNALPDEFTHTGLVHTGENQSIQWVNDRYKAGRSRTDWRFFATSETKEGAWKNQSVEISTISASGKKISMFSINPQEDEVLFPPGSRFFVESVDIESRNDSNRVTIVQREIL